MSTTTTPGSKPEPKRRVTMTLDGALLDELATEGVSLSSVVNEALAEHVARQRHLAGVARIVATWESEHGPISAEFREEARQALA